MFDFFEGIYTKFAEWFENLGDFAIKFFAWFTLPIWILPFWFYRRKK